MSVVSEIELLNCIDVVLSLVIIILYVGALFICISTCREVTSVLRGTTSTESASQFETVARPTSPTQQNQQTAYQLVNTTSIQPQDSPSARFEVGDLNLPSCSTENMFQKDLDYFKYQRASQNYHRLDELDSDISTESQDVSDQHSEYKTRYLHSLEDVQALRDQIRIREYLAHNDTVRKPYQASASNSSAQNFFNKDDDDLCDCKDPKPIKESSDNTDRMVEEFIREEDEIARLTKELEVIESMKNTDASQHQTFSLYRDSFQPRPTDETPLTFDGLRTPTPIDWNEVPQGEASLSAIPSWAVLPEWALDKTG